MLFSILTLKYVSAPAHLNGSLYLETLSWRNEVIWRSFPNNLKMHYLSKWASRTTALQRHSASQSYWQTASSISSTTHLHFVFQNTKDRVPQKQGFLEATFFHSGDAKNSMLSYSPSYGRATVQWNYGPQHQQQL